MKTKSIFCIFTSVLLFIPVSTAFCSLDLLVTSRNTDSVLRYDGTTGQFLDEFISSGSGGLNAPGGIALGLDGYLYVASYNIGKAYIKRYSVTSGDYVDDFIAPQPHFPYMSVRFGPDDNLYTSSEDGMSNVYRYDGQTGEFLGEFLSEGSNKGIGIAFGPDENLYVSNYHSDSIDLYDGDSGVFIDAFVSAASSVGLDMPMGMRFGPDENLYVSGWHANSIFRFNGDTGNFMDEFVGSGSGGLSAPSNIIFGPDGNLYVCSFGSNNILRYNGLSGDFIDVFASGDLDDPLDIVFIPEPCSLLMMTLFSLHVVNRRKNNKPM